MRIAKFEPVYLPSAWCWYLTRRASYRHGMSPKGVNLRGFALIMRHFQVPQRPKGSPASFGRQSATGLDRLPGSKPDGFVARTARCLKKSFLPGAAGKTSLCMVPVLLLALAVSSFSKAHVNRDYFITTWTRTIPD